jgi:hypothetical protein
MLLSNYILNGGARPYLEFGWVTAPNTAGQSITANTITTLTIDTEIADTGNNGSISGNQITLAAGTYYYDALTASKTTTTTPGNITIGLYNITQSKYVSISPSQSSYAGNQYQILSYIRGQFTITSTSVFEIRVLSTLGVTIDNGGSSGALSTLSTAGADQRTTIKLWKLA